MAKPRTDKTTKNSCEIYGARGRQDCMMFLPEDLTLVTDPTHPLYDERVLDPFRENMVVSICGIYWSDKDKKWVRPTKGKGVIEPLRVRKNGEKAGKPVIEVAVGRSRTKATEEANRRLLEWARQEGLETPPPIKLPGIILKGTDSEVTGVMNAENYIRKDDSPVLRARKIQLRLNQGANDDEIAEEFGIQRSQVKSVTALLDLSEKVQTAIDKGTVTPTFALRHFKDVPREDQPAALQKLLDSGVPLRGGAGDKAAEAVKRGETPTPTTDVRARGRTVVGPIAESAALHEAARADPDGFLAGVRCALRWQQGESPRDWSKVEKALTPKA